MIEAAQDRSRFVTAYPVASVDVRAVVHSYKDDTAFEVEFVTAEGSAVALLTLHRADVRPAGSRKVLHIREWAQTPA
jgi:hypothetical protein